MAARAPCSSSAATPSMVLPPGEHTAARRTAGSVPVVKASRAVPAKVCRANRDALSRGRPQRTPASVIASRKRQTKAGPQPVTALPMSSFASSSFTQTPAPSISARKPASSSGVTSGPGA